MILKIYRLIGLKLIKSINNYKIKIYGKSKEIKIINLSPGSGMYKTNKMIKANILIFIKTYNHIQIMMVDQYGNLYINKTVLMYQKPIVHNQHVNSKLFFIR